MVTKALSMIKSATLPFQKVCETYYVVDVTIYPMNGVYCNACQSKSMVQKLGFFCGFIQPMMNLCY
jgi:hypothetical protein